MRLSTFEKKKLRENLIEQIIEFELTSYFYDKTKISKENISVDYYLQLKYCRKQCNLISPTRTQSLTKFNPNMQDFKCVLDLNCK